MSAPYAWGEAQAVIENEAVKLTDALRRRGYGWPVEIWYRGAHAQNAWVIYCEVALAPHISATTLAGVCLKAYAAIGHLPDLSVYEREFSGPLVGAP